MNENANLPPPPPTAYAAPPVAYVPPAPPRPAAPPGKNPAAAGLLSFFPGLGHVYLGLYKRGIVFFAILVMLIAIADRGHNGPFGMLIPFWWIFVLIDAVRQARAINATGMPEPGFFGEEKPFRADGGLTFGIFLILIGLFFLADRLFTIDLSFLLDWWPALLVAFGGWQVFAYFQEKKRREEAANEAAAAEVLKA
jgi:hypothetical protein